MTELSSRGWRFADLEAELHERAIEAVGFDEFGDPAYLEGLRVLLAAYEDEARFNEYGREATRQHILATLEKRLRAEAMWADDPDLRRGEISRPIIILGLVRTGSTALHYLMGANPDLQSLEYWLAANPEPRPDRTDWAPHPNFRAAETEISMMYEADPGLKAIHFMAAELPEECRHLLEQNFSDDGFEVNASVPSYSEWYQDFDMRSSYRRHRDLIRLIGSRDRDRRWLLKYPVHLRNLEALLEVYPDACIVQTHRDPASVLPSYCSLIAGFRAIYEDEFDQRAATLRQMELWAAGAEEAIRVRENHDPAQFFDLHFDDFRSDPVAAVKRIHAYFDQPVSERGERALVKWQVDNQQHKHGRHDYVGRDIGVTDREILTRFAGYMEHFGMTPEAGR